MYDRGIYFMCTSLTLGQRSRSHGQKVKKACEHDNSRAVAPISLQFGTNMLRLDAKN